MAEHASKNGKMTGHLTDHELVTAYTWDSAPAGTSDDLEATVVETLVDERNRQAFLSIAAKQPVFDPERLWEGITIADWPAQAGAGGNGKLYKAGHFPAAEPERPLDLYLAHYKIIGRLVGRAAEQCRDPVLLHFFCHAYRGQQIGEIEHIPLKELFDRYWSQTVASIAERLIRQGASVLPGEAAANVHDYLLNVAAHMLHHNVRAIPIKDISTVARPRKQVDARFSIYEQIHDELVILQEKECSKGHRKLIQVTFACTEFMEYLMARSLIREWNRANLDAADIMQEIESLTQSGNPFANIVGVLIHLGPMLKDGRDLRLWPLLLSKGKRWQQRVFQAFRKLPAHKLDAAVFDALADALAAGDTSIQERALDTMKVKHVAQNAPTHLVNALCQLTTHERESVRRRAVLALGATAQADLALPALLQAVGDPRHSVRKNAVLALEKLGDARAVQPLIAALADSNPHVRQRATSALGKLQQASGLEPLVAALRDSDELVRQAAAQALGQQGDKRAVEPLIAVLQDYYWDVRWAATEALGSLGDMRAVQPLIAALQYSDPGTRQRTLEALGRLEESPLEHLIAALEDRNAGVRWAAVELLDGLGAPTIELLIPILETGSSQVRSRAAQTLGRISDSRVVPPLIQAFKDSAPSVRHAAAEALAGLGDPAVPHLTSALRDSNAHVRQLATRVLGKIWEWPELAELASDDWTLRSKASWVLGQIGESRAVGPLIAALQDRNADVRRAAASGLGHLRDPRAVEPLIAALQDSSAPARLGAAEALGQLGDARVVGPLIEAFNDTDAIVRQTAAEALIRLREPAILPLAAALKDKRGAVKRRAAQALADLGDARTVKPLIAALQNGDRIVKREAVRALNRIGTQEALTAVRQYELRTQGRSRIKKLLTATFLSP